MRALISSLSLILGCATPAFACSVDDDYRVPTNLELTSDAELILVGTIESGPTSLDFQESSMVVHPISVLKGQLTSTPVKLPGMIGKGAFALKSNPENLESAHPLSGIGACFRFSFPQGSTVLFFLKRYPSDESPAAGEMIGPAGGPFARWAEDVPSVDAPWVRATRVYVKVSALPKEQQAAALRQERDAIRDQADTDSRLVAADIDRQLLGPNKPWNQLMDEAIKERRKREQGSLAR